jgi:hypothetical protein
VQADASLLYNGKAGSIHLIGATASGTEKRNGWDFWYVQSNGKLISIDDLRQDYLKACGITSRQKPSPGAKVKGK